MGFFSRQGGTARPAVGLPQALTWREKRWERRRRRRLAEEALGWVLVPVILIGGYWLVTALLGALGTSPSAIIDGVQSVIGGAR